MIQCFEYPTVGKQTTYTEGMPFTRWNVEQVEGDEFAKSGLFLPSSVCLNLLVDS